MILGQKKPSRLKRELTISGCLVIRIDNHFIDKFFVVQSCVLRSGSTYEFDIFEKKVRKRRANRFNNISQNKPSIDINQKCITSKLPRV